MQIIRNYNDANKLLDKGNKLIKIDRDRNNRKYLIFIFEKTDKLMKDLKDITK
ncbi:hypothetical protein ACRTAL_002421 [Clostridium perfringens]|jgi:hypothetical protein|uniref:DUF5659 domain-containing protein n=1 Tax=Clostridium perfringens TaxID=1502 RepID=A0AAW4IYG9_CLOPF|nr:hypothetical protein [Clostridium perfringens]CAJ1760108.1 hypothetical protein AUSP0115_00021 [uncultured phage]MBO3356265.1 hypothetical protein [Clostridium perfringens]MBO3359394.1 hypothetical protein [Clostridium perfringens]MCH1964473.1 hypothetical protein [Clostridium perfringens]MDC4245536.1 hypothetical protein [Clostridium perfringens]